MFGFEPTVGFVFKFEIGTAKKTFTPHRIARCAVGGDPTSVRLEVQPHDRVREQLCHPIACQKRTLFSTFPMFVPSLSW
jgi:hypothetical protein